MALKAIIGALSEVPEGVRGEYRPGTTEEGLDGKFVLDVTPDSGFALENVTGLKSAVSAERGAREKAEAALKAFGDLKPDDVSKQLAKLAELEKLDPAKEADRLAEAKAKAAIDQVTKQHETALAEANAKAEKAMTGLRARTMQAAINDALAKANALNPEALRLKLQSAIRLKETGRDEDPFAIEVLTADGTPAVDGKAAPLTLDSYVADLRKDPVWATSFKPAGKTGSGAEGGQGGQGGTMSRQAFTALSPAEQAKVATSGVTFTD